MSALKVHEKGHADIGRDAARAVEQRLRELGSFPDCPLLEAAVKEAGNGVIAEFSKRELGYDLRTAHGVTQGATFP
jgi:predicted secreted Zn-dependent protease